MKPRSSSCRTTGLSATIRSTFSVIISATSARLILSSSGRFVATTSGFLISAISFSARLLAPESRSAPARIHSRANTAGLVALEWLHRYHTTIGHAYPRVFFSDKQLLAGNTKNNTEYKRLPEGIRWWQLLLSRLRLLVFRIPLLESRKTRDANCQSYWRIGVV